MTQIIVGTAFGYFVAILMIWTYAIGLPLSLMCGLAGFET